MRQRVMFVAGLVAGTAFLSNATLFELFIKSGVRVPNSSTGQVYALDNHGYVRYVTHTQDLTLNALWVIYFAALGVFVVPFCRELVAQIPPEERAGARTSLLIWVGAMLLAASIFVTFVYFSPRRQLH